MARRNPHDYDLCVVGSGSGNMIIDHRFDEWRVALVDSGTFGGTCLNVGCIPTKMYAYPADLAAAPPHAARLGIDLGPTRVRWSDLRDRVFGRIDEQSAEGLRGRRQSPNVQVFTGEARFTGPGILRAGEKVITADRFVLAAGSRPSVPDLPGLADVAYHTSDTVLRLPDRPASMIILGGGYVAAEFAHIFAGFGTRVSVINRSETMLSRQDAEVAARFTARLAERIDLRGRTEILRVAAAPGGGVAADLAPAGRTGPAPAERLVAEVLLVATGRIPNADRLALDEAGVEVDTDGFVRVDEHQQTTAPGVFALGDVCSHRMLKHVANHQARVVRHNLLSPGAMITADLRFVPTAVFSGPQVASVGLTEQQASEQDRPYRVGRAEYAEVAYGWAMEDTGHLAKVLADPRTGALLGGHLVGPQASVLIQPLVQALSFGIGAHEMARGQLWPHPALSEVVEHALLDLDLD